MAQDNSISTDAPMQQSASDEDMREDMRLGMSLNDIHMSISRAFHTMNNTTRPCARSLGLGQGQPRILSYIAVHGVSTQREIARFYSIDPSAVSRLLDPLEREGFLTSVPGRDRRTRALDITEKGRHALPLGKMSAVASIASCFAALPRRKKLR